MARLLAGEQKLKAFQLRKAKFIRTSGQGVSASAVRPKGDVLAQRSCRTTIRCIVGHYTTLTIAKNTLNLL